MQPMLLLLRSQCCKRLLYVLILSLNSIYAHAYTGAQNDHPVTLNGNNITLRTVFKAIKQQTGFAVMYSTAATALNQDEKVSVHFKDTPLDDVLAYLLKGKELDWKYSDDVLVIHKKEAVVSEKKMEVDSTVIPAMVTGKVTDAKGAPLIGATVQVKGTNQGATTDAEGNFALEKVKKGSTLMISSVGYEKREVAVSGSRILTQLNVDVSKLDETVVIAYGTTTRRMLTGNVSTVKAKDIEKSPVNNPLLALQGRVPGIFITQANGLPGTGVTVRVQGQNSLSKGNDPLYVIDGVPYTSQLFLGASVLGDSGGNENGNPLSFINPADIESMDILKDADATAIYGSRAANGAILITTKKGKAGQTRVNINIQNGWGKVTQKLPLLNTQQYLEMRHEAKRNDNNPINATDYDINGTWDSTRYTDWQKALIGGIAHYTDVQGSVSGGTSSTQFLIGAGYHRETLVFPGTSADKKGSIHFSISNTSANQRFKIQLTGSYLSDNNRLISTDLTSAALLLPPNAPSLYNPDGSLNWAPDASGNSTWKNPITYTLNGFKSNTNNLIGNAVVSYLILPGIDARCNLGYTNLQINEVTTNPLLANAPETRQFQARYSSFSNGKITSWIIEPQLAFNYKILGGTSETLIGSSIQQKDMSRQPFSASGFNSDLILEDLSSAPVIYSLGNEYILYRYNGVFGRTSYNWKDKYIVNLTIRRDGSSRFGSENLFHNFWSIAGAWIFSNETFLKQNVPFISFGKFRGSYGTTGNDQIGDYQFMSLYNNMNQLTPYQASLGLSPSNLPNPYLQWEETRKLQLGLDIGVLKDRLLLNATYYRNRSSNQLQDYSLPITTGFYSILQNFPATVQNSGWEFTLMSTNFQNNNFTWTSNMNITIPQNKLVKYQDLATSTRANDLIIGEPITISKIFNFAGVNSTTGISQFTDKTGKITLLPDFDFVKDRFLTTNLSPKFFGGLQNSFSYKEFSLDLLFQFVKQMGNNYILGNQPGFFSSDAYGIAKGNQPIYVLARWQQAGDNSEIQKFSSSYPSGVSLPYLIANVSNIAFSDASYIRLKNLSLSWQIPSVWKSKAHIQSARLYIQGQNLLTFTSYRSLDPETRSVKSLPPLKVLTVGAQVSF